MTLYKDVDESVVVSCRSYKNGSISVGELKRDLIKAARQIVSIEDKNIRYFLLDCEAEIDRSVALYYGSEGVDNLENMYMMKDKLLEDLTLKIVDKICEKMNQIDYSRF